MNMSKFLFYISVLVITVAGCKSAVEKETLKKIDKQLLFIDNTLKEFEKLPVDSLMFAYRDKLSIQTEQITALFENSDNQQLNVSTFIPFLNYTGTLHKRFIMANETLLKMLRCKHQLETLRKDISKGKIPNDSIVFYYQVELSYFNPLLEKIPEIMEFKTIGAENRVYENIIDSILSISNLENKTNEIN